MEKADLSCVIQIVAVTRELDTLINKIDDKIVLNNSQLQSFRKFCFHQDSLVAKLGCDAVVNFVKQDKLSLTEAIPWFISSLQSADNIKIITMAIRDLLLLNINKQNQKSVPCPFGLISPQHPFILILKENCVNWPHIDFHIQYMFKCGNSNAIFSLLSPFFKYVLWSPPGSVDQGCKISTWKLLVNNYSTELSDFVTKTICWLRTDDENSVLNANFILPDLLNMKCDVDKRQKANFMCVLSAEIACKAARLCQDPFFALAYSRELLKKYPETSDLVLILIAASLPSCPIMFVADFLYTCIEVINANGISNLVIIWMIIGALLPWIIHSTNATRKVTIIANSLFDIVEGKSNVPVRKASISLLQNDSWFIKCITCHTNSYWAFVIARTIEINSFEDYIEKLSSFTVTSDIVQENFIVNLFFTGVSLYCDDLNIQLGVLDILMKKNAGFQLPLLLFKLSKATHPELHVKLLHSLPLTAVVKENIPPILATIRSLLASGKPVLKQLSYSLYSTLWKTEERCYQFLHDKLISWEKETIESDPAYETDIVIASIIRDICVLKPEIHGKEWVKVLADTISRYPKRHDCLPLTIALEAVITMCKTRSIDVFGVYEEFEKKQLLIDQRTEVIKQLCDMIGFIFEMARELKVDSQEPLRVIWRFLEQSSEEQVIEAGLSALSKYNFEEMPLSVIPDEYKKNLKIPRLRSKQNRAVGADELPPYIPGTLWLDYLRNAPQYVQPKICKLLTVWLSREVKNFSRSIFHSVHRERESVLSFHDKSIFKATVNYCKYVAKKLELDTADIVEIKMMVFCLEILNGQATKALPPFNWSFMAVCLDCKNEELRKQVIQFWAKESVMSVSARNCVEAWLKKIDVKNYDRKELELAFGIVSCSCISTPSQTIVSFLSTAMQFVLEKTGIDEHEIGLYRSTCICLRKALKHPEIDEHNCEAICKNLVNWWENAAILSECFDELIDTVKEMPRSYVDYVSSLILSTNVSTENLYKILKLRCSIALSDPDNPFFWLNDCIEATSRRLQDRVLFFEQTLEVFTTYRLKPGKWTWLLLLLNRVQISADVLSEEVCEFMYDIFIFCVVNTSPYHPFLNDATSIDECYEYFPQALRSILIEDVSSQVIECSSNLRKVNARQKSLFTDAIIASRSQRYLQKVTVWSNIVEKL